MNHINTISDEFLHALVDGQLSSVEEDEVLLAMRADASLRDRVCELRGLKLLVQHAYPKPADDTAARHRFLSQGWRQSLAAGFMLLTLGGVAGWLAHDWKSPAGEGRMVGAPQALQQNDYQARPVNYLMHIDTANPDRLKMALDEAESLLSNRDGPSAQVEIMANGPGLNLLREGVSPYARRLLALQAKYPKLTLMACGKTIQKLQDAGIAVQLLPRTQVTPSALDEIISRRLKQHWVYLKV